MTWWGWAIAWIVLVLAGALILFVAARRLYRQGMELARELGTAATVFAEVARTVQAGAELRADAAGGRDAARARGESLTSVPAGPSGAGSRMAGRHRLS